MRKCATCGIGIVTSRADAKFCSTRCRVTAHRNKGKDQIPQELKNRARWVRRTTNKVPVTIYGTPASSTNPATWTTYQEAAASKTGAGLGYVLGDGIGCIDLDHCIEDGHPTPEAARYLKAYPDNWIEISPSGDGLHIWGTAEPAPGTKTTVNGLNVERYTTGRYITVTGHTHQPGTLAAL
jgi:primase-polymerase (primpol)-like protein